MSKRIILILAFAFVVGIAFSAYAEVQNVKVSGDINMMGVSRGHLSLQGNTIGTGAFTTGYGQYINTLLSIIRLRVDADLTDNVSTTIRLINERTWGGEIDNVNNSVNSNIDLDLAYVTLKEFLYSPLNLTIGRQEIKFGNAFIIGAPYTNAISAGHGIWNKPGLPDSIDDLSMRRSFDAIRATLNYDPLVIDLIYAKIQKIRIQDADSINLFGLNANYAFNKDLVAELYWFQRERQVGSIAPMQAAERLNTNGARVNYTGVENLTLGAEVAVQTGNHVSNTTIYPNEGANDNRTRTALAYAFQLMGNYVMPKIKYTPSVGASYTYLSGDSDVANGDNSKKRYSGWDPMYKDQGSGTLFNKILGYSNAQIVNLNGSMKPMDDVKVSLNYYYLKLNKTYNNDANAINLTGVAGDPTYGLKEGNSYLGSEVDLGVTYDYTEDVQIGLNGGMFVPGSVFRSSNRKTATQVIGSMKVTF